MLGKIFGGGGIGGGLGGLGRIFEKLNPMKMLEKLMSLPQMLMGMLGGGGGPMSLLKGFDPMSLLGGLIGGANQRGL
jgi:hypothetical protein